MYTKKQQAEHRKLWVEALRSGKYTQCKNMLCNGKGHCCLGVACEVAIENGLEVKKQEGYDSEEGFNPTPGEFYYDMDSETLPGPVRNWLGLSSNCGTLISGPRDLTVCNDNLEMSFDKIADLIEEGKIEVV